MARILGVLLPDNKKVKISLRYLYGIGPKRADEILAASKIDPDKKMSEIKEEEIKKIQMYIEANFLVEGQLKQETKEHIRRLRDIRAYRGIRHILGLPARGQRTRHNAHTRKGRNQAVGGLNPKVTKT
jgi:small subunit ribosomal protein S13